MKTIVNGVEITLTEEQIAIVNGSKYDKVFAYHGLSWDEFEKAHAGVSLDVRAFALLKLVVAMYNRGERLDWDNGDQPKYYPYFNLEDECVSLDFVSSGYHDSVVPPSLCFFSKEDCQAATNEYSELYKTLNGSFH